MKKILHKTLLATSLGCIFSMAHALDGDAAAGKEAAGLCVACHQADGGGMNIPGTDSWPRLAGINAGYMFKQLQDFKSGKRHNVTMQPFANMLNEQQMKDISVYYAQLPATAGKGGEDATEQELKLGEKLAQHGDWDRYIVPCMSCHGPDNNGAGEHFPGIAGQHASYISDQLKAWKEGRRGNDPQDLMLAIAERMTDEDIRAVSVWLSRQPAQN